MLSRIICLAVLTVSAGCSKTSAPAGLKLTLSQPARADVVQIDVETTPGLMVLVKNEPAIQPRDSHTSATADASGHATLLFDPGTKEGETREILVAVRNEKQEIGYARVSHTRPPAPALRFMPDYVTDELRCFGTDLTCELVLRRGTVVATDFPAGAVLTVEGRDVPLVKGAATVELDPLARTASRRYDQVCGDKAEESKPIAITVTLAGQPAVAGEMKSKYLDCSLFENALLGAVRGPVLPDAGKGTKVALNFGSSGTWYSADPDSLADVRVVLVATEVEREDSCGEYTNDKGITIPFERDYTDLQVVAYERSTGKQLADKVFRAPALQCKRSIKGGGDMVSVFDDKPAVLKWGKSLGL